MTMRRLSLLIVIDEFAKRIDVFVATGHAGILSR